MAKEMTTLRRIFSRRIKDTGDKDTNRSDLELGSVATVRTPNDLPSTPHQCHTAPHQTVPRWDQSFVAAAHQLYPISPKPTYEHSNLSTVRGLNHQLPTTRYRPAFPSPRLANIDTESVNQMSAISPLGANSGPISLMSPEQCEYAMRTVATGSPASSVYQPQSQHGPQSSRGIIPPRHDGRHTDDLFEDISAYEQDESSSHDGSQNGIPHHTPSMATLIRHRTSSDLGRYAWSPPESDDESDELTSLAEYNNVRESHDASMSNEMSTSSHAASLVPSHRRHPVDIDDSISPEISIISEDSLTDPSMPYIDVDIPAGNFNLGTNSNLPSSSVIRYSGLVAEGRSRRPMSEAEIGESLRSLGDIIRSGLNTPSSDKHENRTSMQWQKGNDPVHNLQTSFPRDKRKGLAALDPGSSQTSSSLSADHIAVIATAPRGRTTSHNDSSSSQQIRSPTPPLLYGRRTFTSSETSRPALDRKNSRLAKAMKENGVSDTSRLGQAYPLGSAEQDWVTESDLKVSHTHPTGDLDSDGQTGSSLADNSDSGNLSSTAKMQTRFESINSRRLPPNLALPRLNQSFVIVKDAQTGRAISVPQHGIPFRIGALRNDSNNLLDATGSSNYHHPVPLSGRHLNPFNSSPPVIRAPQSSSEASAEDQPHEIGKAKNRDTILTAYTDDFDEIVEQYDSTSESATGKGQSREPVIDVKPHGQKGNSPPESSAWLSTTGEVSGRDQTSPIRQGSFAKVTVLSHKGNVTGTPEGTGAREVGSSLAGVSSPPGPPSSPCQSSVESMQAVSPSKTPTLELDPFASPKSLPSISSRIQALNYRDPHKTRRRRSSSESNCKTAAPPMAVKVSAMPSPEMCVHRKTNSHAGLLSKEASSPFDDENTEIVPEVIRPKVAISANAPNKSQLSLARLEEKRPRSLSELKTMGITIARVESPHLYRFPVAPSKEILERQNQISNFWLILFAILPPLSLIFGYGYADGIMRMQTAGEIGAFSKRTKALAVYWAYGATSTFAVVVLVVAALGLFS